MVTVYRKTPMARKAARNYCRRCLAVMLCCVLVFASTVRTAPKAKAVAVVDDVALLGLAFSGANLVNSFAQRPVEGSLGQFVLAGSGVGITSGVVMDNGTTYYDPKAQELGVELVTHLVAQGGEAAQWVGETVASFQAKGGLAPGDSFSVPAAVVAATRQWAQTVLDFEDENGVTSFNNRLILGGDGPFLLTDADTTSIEASGSGYEVSISLRRLGRLIGFEMRDLSSSYRVRYDLSEGLFFTNEYDLTEIIESGRFKASVKTKFWCPGSEGGYNCSFFVEASKESLDDLIAYVSKFVSSNTRYATLIYSAAKNRLYPATYDSSSGKVSVVPRNYYALEEEQAPATVATTITKSPVPDETPVAPILVTVPVDLPVATVGDFTVPLSTQLTQDVLTGAQDPATPTAAPVPGGLTAGDIAGAIGQAVPGAVASGIAQALPDALAQALPITGAIAGDAVVTETLAEPDSLGAVFVSKFPFCIPWDLARFIGLFAAKPVTPRFEVDFLAPIGYRVGGWNGSTKVVLDMSDFEIVGQLCRWFSTAAFVFALISGTKRYIWTA